jgi:phage gp45-like
VSDPEKRFRVRVRIAAVHQQGTPKTALRWAEVASAFSAPGASDLPHYEVGDRVFVMFEGGEQDYPVVIGSWVAARGGLNDVPYDITQDYEVSRRRWTRVDRRGNMMEISEVPTDLHVKLKSGKASVIITQRDDSIVLKTTGAVSVIGGRVNVSADQAVLDANQVTLAAVDNSVPGSPAGVMHITANKDINIYVKDAAQGGSPTGDINVGQYVDSGQITAGGIPAPHQSPTVNVFARDVNIGQYVDGFLLPTLNVAIAAQAEVSIKSAALVSVEAPAISVDGDTTLTGDLTMTGDITVTGKVTATGEVQSGLIPLTLHKHTYTDNGNPGTTSPSIP